MPLGVGHHRPRENTPVRPDVFKHHGRRLVHAELLDERVHDARRLVGILIHTAKAQQKATGVQRGDVIAK